MPEIVYVVLVNYNRANDTLSCIESLLSLRHAYLRIIVVDNGSEDNSRAELRAAFSVLLRPTADKARPHLCSYASTYSTKGQVDFLYVPSPDNLGFAGGCNIGIEIALADPACDFIWLLNNDTIVYQDSLTQLLLRMRQDPSAGMCGSTLVYPGTPQIIQAVGGKFNLITGRGRNVGAYKAIGELPQQQKTEAEMDYVVGASLMVSRRFVENVGLMDDRYFLYFEELDWAIRGRRLGFRPIWAPASIVIHKEGSATGSSSKGRPSDISLHFMASSYLRLIIRHKPFLLPIAALQVTLRCIKWTLKCDFGASYLLFRALCSVWKNPSRSLGLRDLSGSQ